MDAIHGLGTPRLEVNGLLFWSVLASSRASSPVASDIGKTLAVMRIMDQLAHV
jgi:hypothetical protein